MITVGIFRSEDTSFDPARPGGGVEEVVITKHGKPVARLVSATRIDRERVNEAFEVVAAQANDARRALLAGASGRRAAVRSAVVFRW